MKKKHITDEEPSDEVTTNEEEALETLPEPEPDPAPEFDAKVAEKFPKPFRHEPTARTVVYHQDGYLYSATGAPIAKGEKPAPVEEPAPSSS